jgi:hypothetical protein
MAHVTEEFHRVHPDEDILHYYPLAKTQQKKGQVA